MLGEKTNKRSNILKLFPGAWGLSGGWDIQGFTKVRSLIPGDRQGMGANHAQGTTCSLLIQREVWLVLPIAPSLQLLSQF